MGFSIKTSFIIGCGICALSVVTVYGQVEPVSRAAEIEAARDAKSTTLTPDVAPRLERRFTSIERNPLNPLVSHGGWRLAIGGVIPSAGFAMGPQYVRTGLLKDNLDVRVSALGSTRLYYLGRLELSLPHLWKNRAFIDFDTTHRNLAQLPYYGPGADSVETGRSDYRLEDTSVDIRLGVRKGNLKAGVTGGYLAVNVGPGTSDRFISTEKQFGPSVAPGIDRQTNFWRTGGFIQYDWRDRPGKPRSGGNYLSQYLDYRDRELGLFGFSRLDLEAQQYLGFFNKKRVIALRGRAAFTYPGSGEVVPFYLQPRLGGADTLRGFRSFRFYGNNSLVMNAEYRWEASSVLDAAIFFDAGKVFDKPSDMSVYRLEKCIGFGFRFMSLESLAVRLDTGFSREGFQIWFRINDIF